jgi:hypothetical protein
MKKFGTPNGAGPGSAKEKVGLLGVGTPGPVIPAPGASGLAFFFLASFLAVFVTVVAMFFPVPLTSLPRVLPEPEKLPEAAFCLVGLPEPIGDPVGALVVLVVGVVDGLEGVEEVVGVVVVAVVSVGVPLLPADAVGVGLVLVEVGVQLAMTL